jgi:CubicO group peptidase (beta-lactamase class C family)
MSDFADVTALVADYQRRGGQPGLAYGIVFEGELVHATGLGKRRLGGPPPDADTVFRIASMTKSFTATAILLLRDEGALTLDDLAEEYVPELGGWPPVTVDAARVSIRHLLTMTAGFPTDDPWGDRQQGLPLDEFAKFLAGGLSFAWAPGTRFEYSNLGYAILGRVITGVTSMAYPDFITDRLLTPLGMTRSGFEPAQATDADGLAHGYRLTPAGWQEVPLDPCGAFAPMGGVYTCVRDLAPWVAGFAAAFPPGAADPANAAPGTGHPLLRASRREMQLPQAPTGWDRPASFPADGSRSAYGFGLALEDDPVHGRIVGHGGGYPGFGSYMRWHPATGIGVIALGNSTYARMAPLTERILDVVLRERQAPAAGYPVALAPASQPWPETLAARDTVNELLESWDDTVADRLFAPNVALDAPYEERKSAIALIPDRIGPLRDPQQAPQHDSPAHCRWWLSGEHGVVQVQILLTPERPPRVQSVTLAIPPASDSLLRSVLDNVIGWLNGGEPVPTADGADGLDAGRLARQVKACAAWAGPVTPGAYTAGDGSTSVSVELAGEHATGTLSLTIEPATGQLRQADITF